MKIFRRAGHRLITLILIVSLLTTTTPVGAANDKSENINDSFLAALNSIESFSTAPRQQIKIITDYLSIDADSLIAAEKQGYSIKDSISVAKIKNNTGFTYAEIKQGLINYSSISDFLIAIEQYKGVIESWKFSARTIAGLKKCLLMKYSMQDIRDAAIISELFNSDVFEVARQDAGSSIFESLSDSYTSEEAEGLYAFMAKYRIKLSWFLEYTQKNSIKWKDFYTRVEAYFTAHSKKAALKDLEEKTGSVSQGGKNTTNSLAAAAAGEQYKAPFSYDRYAEDKVEMNTGNLVIENEDVYLPGKNGLDLTLTSRYNSGDELGETEYIVKNTSFFRYNLEVRRKVILNNHAYTEIADELVRSYSLIDREESLRIQNTYNVEPSIRGVSADGQYVYIYYTKEKGSTLVSGNAEDIHRNYTPTHRQKQSPLGIGWGFEFDSIEIVTYDTYYNVREKKDSRFYDRAVGKYLHLEDGRKYRIKDNLELEGYPLKDMQLKYDTTCTNGQGVVSQYVLQYKDGIKKYFAADGRLLKKADRYGNAIEYQHTLINNYPVVTRIIDSLNREVTINYDFANLQVVVNAPENKRIVYSLAQEYQHYNPNKESELIYTYGYLITGRKDFENRSVKYQYIHIDDLYMRGDSACITPASMKKLNKITYPTGAYTEYTYKGVFRFMPQGGSELSASVEKRTMVDIKKNISNVKYYVYKNNYTRYPYYESDRQYDELRNYYPEKYSYIIVDWNDSTTLANEYIFDYENKMNFEDKYRTFNLSIIDRYYLYDSLEYRYDNTNRQVTKKILKKYSMPSSEYANDQDLSKYLLYVEDFTYDQFGNVVSYWGPEAVRNSELVLTNPSNDDHLLQYSYDTSHYNILLEKRYKKDAVTTISETNTLTGDWKNVSQAAISVNGVMESRTTYGYDQWNNVMSEKRYLKDGGWTKYVETNYEYNDNDTSRNSNYRFNGAYLTRKYSNGTYSDGELLSQGTEEKFKYDNYGNQVQYKDSYNNETKFEYDKLGRLTKKTNPDGSQVINSYDDINNILTATGENGNQIKYEYDSLGNLLYKTDTATGKYLEAYVYNTDFRLDTQRNNQQADSGNSIKYQYYHDGRIKAKTIKDKNDAILAKEEYLYADAYDLDNDGKADCSKTTRIVSGDENSPTATYNTYTDRAGRVIRDGVVHNGRELFNTYQYDYLGNKLQEKSARANEESWTEPYTMKYTCDYAGRLLETTDILGQRSTAVYDALGRVTKKKDNRANAQALPYAAEYTYDNNGRVIVEKIPFEEKPAGTVYYTIKKHYYDSNGNVISERITNNKPGQAAQYSRTDYAYNSKNQLIKTTTFEGDRPQNYTQYYYDTAGNKVRMYTGLSSPLTISGLDAVTPGTDREYSVTKYSYDRFNRLEAMTDPMGRIETYSYDLNGNLIGKTDRNSNITATVYDGLNRPKTVTVTTPEHTGDVAASYQYTLTGNKQAVTSGNVTTLYRYDDLGRLCTETSADVVKEYGYDANNNRKTFKVTKNGAGTINTSYVYDKMNRLEQLYENSELQAVYSYDANGNRKTLSYTNGNTTTYDYNLSNKLTSLVNRDGMTEISGYSYTYYLDGNQASKTDSTGKVTAYQYDGLGRLTNEAPAGEPAIAYTYDDSNNRKTMTVDGVSSTAYVYDGNNRLTEETKNAGQSSETTHYNYDNNGNTICKYTETISPATQGQTTEVYISVAGTDESSNGVNNDNSVTINEYNGLNQLVKVTEGSNTYGYTYNWDGLRASKTVNGVTTNHIWDGDQMVLETDGTGNVTNKYIRGINLIYSGEGANRRYFLYNGHGDTVQLTSTTGSSIKTYDYDAFGNEKNADPNDTNLFRYCGEYFDKETGTIYLRARYYDPAIGRFITEDSYWGKDSDPLSLNLYTYCYNNGVNYFDPSGHEYIVVSGGRYSNDSKDFKYNFIEPAIKELRELRELDSKENITWVISMAGWSNTDREHFIYVAKDIGVDVKFIHYASDLTDYINCKDGSNRSNDKITKFFVFSHGLPGSIELGYSQDNASNYSISMDDIDSIDSNAFNNPYSWFGSCRTGTDVNGQNYSFAQKWVNQVGGTTRAIVGRSWYGDMNRGESLKNKIYRFIYGFSIYGSVNYPVTYSKQKAYWETFNPQN